MAGEESLTDDDIKAFTDKLNSWGQALNPKEQAILRMLIDTALEPDVEGYRLEDFGDPSNVPTQEKVSVMTSEWRSYQWDSFMRWVPLASTTEDMIKHWPNY